MRRPRHKLQVSTFPFLAVLLGAMGSLIFLLLVMDRRAKIVARAKVLQEQQARSAAVTEAERQRQADWERQRRQLHDTLAAQDQHLRAQIHNVVEELDQSGQQLRAHTTTASELQKLLETEQGKLTQAKVELQARQTALLQSDQTVNSSNAELARMTRDLEELERTLEGLKRLKSQARPTYSLVPYRGQRGENRMPIYVECTRVGLVFLPDRLTLTGDDLDLPQVRAEVERRHGPLVKAQRAEPLRAAQTSDQPYVLFLVRPDGISSYYHGQNALRGYDIDFGYELVDADWTLNAPTQQTPPFHVQTPTTKRTPVSRSTQFNRGQSSGPGTSPVSPSPQLFNGRPSGPLTMQREIGSLNQVPPPVTAPSSGGPDGAGNGLRKGGEGANAKQPMVDPHAPGAASAKRQAGVQLGFENEPPTEPAPAMARLATPSPLPEKQAKTAPAPWGRVLGNRDFILTLACYQEGVLLTPGGASFVWDERSDPRQIDEALVRAVNLLVTRRQATVRPGEPAYRPVLRFEVHEQGRRTYHRVYPLLEKLRLPMVREDVQE